MTWPWLALVGLGAFHGVNPAMGWLFAVALGLHRRSRAVVLESLVPIAVGHAVAVALVAFAVVALSLTVDQRAIRYASGSALIGWAVYHRLYGSRHRVRVGMRAGMAGLALWSFLMASAHGAGLMVIPVVLPLCASAAPASDTTAATALPYALAALAVHTAAMLAAIAAVSLVVYNWIGVDFLRRGWINLDVIWVAALAACGLILLIA